MDFDAIRANVADQDKGRNFDILDPVTGEPTGISMRIAGPDSEVQRRAMLELTDELAEMAGPDGRVAAAHREKARINCLAKCVLDWEIEEGGKPITFDQANVVRVLSAGKWLQAQVDAFASDRSAFRSSQR